MFEKLIAGITLAACLVLMVRLVLGARRRHKFDKVARQFGHASHRAAVAPYRRWRARKNAVKVAEDAIRRARGGEWQGNVYRPKSFRRPPKKPD